MTARRRFFLLSTAMGVASLIGMVAMSPGVASASSNANFKGTWNAATGGWVIKTENMTTGVCTGTSDYGPSYHFGACKVTGDNYVFTITVGSYVSHNSGTIHGNHVTGKFHDSNGASSTYVATRS